MGWHRKTLFKILVTGEKKMGNRYFDGYGKEHTAYVTELEAKVAKFEAENAALTRQMAKEAKKKQLP